MKKSNKIIVFLGIMLTAGLVLLAPAGLRAAGEDRIAEGVYIGNISVGGMTEKEAADAVSSYVKSVGDAVLTLTAGEKSVEVTAAELGTFCCSSHL